MHISKQVKQSLKNPEIFQARIYVTCKRKMALVGDCGQWRWEVQI